MKETMKEIDEFRVSADQLKYLQQIALQDESLAGIFGSQESSPGRAVIIRLNRTDVEKLRDCLTERLAAVGFDENYSPNEQGRMLEELIDRFHIP